MKHLVFVSKLCDFRTVINQLVVFLKKSIWALPEIFFKKIIKLGWYFESSSFLHVLGIFWSLPVRNDYCFKIQLQWSHTRVRFIGISLVPYGSCKLCVHTSQKCSWKQHMLHCGNARISLMKRRWSKYGCHPFHMGRN